MVENKYIILIVLFILTLALVNYAHYKYKPTPYSQNFDNRVCQIYYYINTDINNQQLLIGVEPC